MTENLSETIIDFLLASLISLLAWFFGGLDGYLKVLLAFSIIDYISGTCAAIFLKELSSSIGFYGIMKKCVMLTFVGIAHLIDKYLVGQMLESGQMFRNAVCLFYIGNEGISIIENAVRLNIPVPKMLTDRLLHFKDGHTEKITRNKKNSKKENKKST